MIEIKGKYTTAKALTDYIEKEALQQIETLCSQEWVKDSMIRIMPDVHAGKGCVVGLAMNIRDRVAPNLVGVDIGCGMSVTKFKKDNINLEELDKFIHENIPCGFSVHASADLNSYQFKNKGIKEDYKDAVYQAKEILKDMRCFIDNKEHLQKSIGTLGGGNHFIELNKDKNGFYYLVIHSGSRNLGVQVCNYYQDYAKGYCKDLNVPKGLEYVTGKTKRDYLFDLYMATDFAEHNRDCMRYKILDFLDISYNDVETEFHTIHNYIDTDYKILRKGCVSAQQGEMLIIPINMRDGSLICKGKGNEDWLCTAPHGAGRIMSRKKAKENITMATFKNSMKDVYTSCVCESTLDESPMAYKSLEEIQKYLHEVVEVVEQINPIYNFKAK